ncbi:MAG: S16 family serine protease, partial [Gaiellaceae bacterium]
LGVEAVRLELFRYEVLARDADLLVLGVTGEVDHVHAVEQRRRTADPGVATGLAVTATGGDVLFIEASAYPGRGRLRVTGQLGEVMQESAQAALSWVRSHSQLLGLDPEWFASHDIHVHVPAGAVPKDGPSAGITMVTAIVSLVSGQPVSEQVAMTGEVTLSGQVLGIGGVRDKVLAAQRAGVQKIVLPKENEPDLEELPSETKKELEFVLADHVDDVLAAAFDGASPVSKPRRVGSPERKAAAPA